MILSCSSCEKKFVVPDQAITAKGRTVQCGSCGNKWKQFPISKEIENKSPSLKTSIKKTPINKKSKIEKNKIKKVVKRQREMTLYSPEYLAKKHGININQTNTHEKKQAKNEFKTNFGFYNSLILFVILSISSLRLLFFSRQIIINKIPVTEPYLEYLFESIKNIYTILKSFIAYY